MESQGEYGSPRSTAATIAARPPTPSWLASAHNWTKSARRSPPRDEHEGQAWGENIWRAPVRDRRGEQARVLARAVEVGLALHHVTPAKRIRRSGGSSRSTSASRVGIPRLVRPEVDRRARRTDDHPRHRAAASSSAPAAASSASAAPPRRRRRAAARPDPPTRSGTRTSRSADHPTSRTRDRRGLGPQSTIRLESVEITRGAEPSHLSAAAAPRRGRIRVARLRRIKRLGLGRRPTRRTRTRP